MFKWLTSLFRKEEVKQELVVDSGLVVIQAGGSVVVSTPGSIHLTAKTVEAENPNDTTIKAIEDSYAGRVEKFESVDATLKDVQAKGRATRKPAKPRVRVKSMSEAPTRKATKTTSETTSRRDADDGYSTSLLNPLNPISPVSVWSDTSSSSSCSSSSYDSGSSSYSSSDSSSYSSCDSSSSYDSGSSSCGGCD